MVQLAIPENYGGVLFMTLTLAFFINFVGFGLGGGGRKAAFTPEVLQKFQQEHEEAFGKDSKVDKMGYPDNGSSRYSKELSYKQWFNYNVAQRNHQSLLDQAIPILVFGLVSGLKYPKVTTYLMAVYMASKIITLFFAGDIAKDAAINPMRLLGHYLGLCGTLGLGYYAMKSSLQIAEIIGPDSKAS